MNYIGSIIKQLRCALDMSREALSQGICSEKYIYLIEKGERTPSSDMLRMLGDKLGADLFDYYQYLACADPMQVSEYIRLFEIYRRKSDFAMVNEVNDRAAKLPDFQNKPWLYEIEINKLCYAVFCQHRYRESIPAIKEMIGRIEAKYAHGTYAANAYVLLSACCQHTGDLACARAATQKALSTIERKEGISSFVHAAITVKLSSLILHYYMGDYRETIRQGEALLQYQNDRNEYDRVVYPFFYIAFSYYRLQAHEQAVDWFKKGLYFVLIHQRPVDVYYLSQQDAFRPLLKSKQISWAVAQEFMDLYHFS